MINAAIINDRPPRKNLQRLLSYPFTQEEKDSFVNHLTSLGNSEIAQEILLMWNIQNARYSTAREMMKMDGYANDKRRIIREGLEKVDST